MCKQIFTLCIYTLIGSVLLSFWHSSDSQRHSLRAVLVEVGGGFRWLHQMYSQKVFVDSGRGPVFLLLLPSLLFKSRRRTGLKVGSGSGNRCNTKIFIVRLNWSGPDDKGINILLLSFSNSDLLPLRDEENQHDKDFLKHHDEDVEDTLAQPCCALHRLPYTHTHTERNRWL